MCFLFVSRNFYWLFNAVPSMDVFGANWTSVYSLKLRKMFGIPRFSVKQWTIRWSCIRWAISIITCQCVEFHWKYDDCEWFLVINCNLSLLLFLGRISLIWMAWFAKANQFTKEKIAQRPRYEPTHHSMPSIVQV